jgi:hypothetical protein
MNTSIVIAVACAMRPEEAWVAGFHVSADQLIWHLQVIERPVILRTEVFIYLGVILIFIGVDLTVLSRTRRIDSHHRCLAMIG